ncbi:hypothetical protein ACFFRF_10915 [Microbacterium laevaniformans]|uniref:hypothetical protein n=1 Tax=Microbacterium laevaniformans TaxID=36807 RepID=UPI001E5F8BAD|nr:hypothetical protein [Microbacterium laevaniformans]
MDRHERERYDREHDRERQQEQPRRQGVVPEAGGQRVVWFRPQDAATARRLDVLARYAAEEPVLSGSTPAPSQPSGLISSASRA